jgi:hypothetical protein
MARLDIRAGGRSSCGVFDRPCVFAAGIVRARAPSPTYCSGQETTALAGPLDALSRAYANPRVKGALSSRRCLVENSEELSAELDRLLKKQLDAMAENTLVGLTDKELCQYNQRNERIHELFVKLRKLKDTA